MDAVFLKLIELSIIGSCFVLAVILLRLVFRNAPKWVFCLLWGMVALRLIVPVQIESKLSLVPDNVSEKQIASQMAQSYVGDVTYIHEGGENYQAAVDAGRKPIQSGGSSYVITQEGSLEEPKTVKSAVLPVLSHIWITGLIIMLSYTLISYLTLRRKVSAATLFQGNIKESEYVDSPFVLGLIRPVIYLPYGLDDSDRENVVAHERAHIQRGDHWWKPIGFLILSVYCFNPVMWLAYILLCRDIEGACDEKVIKKLDKDGIRAYSLALLNCSVHRRSIAACPLAFGEVGVKARIKRVMHYKKPAFWIVLLALIASVLSVVLLLTTPPEDIQEQNKQTESTQPTESMTDMEVILSLLDEIVYNPAMAASSNPYDYINAAFDKYAKILLYEETAKECLLIALEESDDNGLREYIMAAVCVELTDFGQDKQQIPWASGKEWLSLYQAHLARLDEPVGTVEDEIGSLLEVGSLLGVDSAWMRIVDVMDHPNRLDLHRYSYRFQYYDKAGQEWYLVEIHACLGYKIGDFDNDGINELFYFTDTQEYPYYICDLVDGNLVEEGYTLVPDSVLDYDLLLDREGLYLYEERWAWFFKDPATYVAEVAKRPEDRLYYICPNGIIPAYTAVETIGNAVTTLQEMLTGEVAAYEKTIIYKLLTTIELTYNQKLFPNNADYQILFEKWDYPYEGSTEEKNVYEQLSDLFDADPVAFLKGMATVDKSVLKKDLQQVVTWLANENFLYDADAFESVLNWLEQGANTDREKILAQMFRDAYEAMEAPSLKVGTMLKEETTALWDALSFNPEQALYNLGKAKDTELKRLGQNLWGSEPPSQKLLEKCYIAVNSLLAKDPAGTLRDVCYKVLLYVEWYGGYRDEYVEDQPFDYQRLFDKWTYSDGALATNCYSQMYEVFAADPETFMETLIQWNKSAPEGRGMEMIALQFACKYLGSADYSKTLHALLENPATAEGASVFIQQLEKITE